MRTLNGQASGSLSIRRVGPKRTASESSAGSPSVRRSSSARVRPSATLTYAGIASGSALQDLATSRRAGASADRSPASQRARAASSARRRTGAAARSAGERWTFRDDSASPSGSRTVGQAIDLGGDREVAGHLADDHHLLGVLLPEVGSLCADQVEQDRDDRGDPVEVAGPRRALERAGDRADRRRSCRTPAGRPRSTPGRRRRRCPPPRRSRGRGPRSAGSAGSRPPR